MFIRRAWRNLRRKASPYSIAASTDPCGDCPSTSCAEQAADELQDSRQRRQKFPWSFRRQAEEDASCPAEGGCGFWQTSLTALLQSKKSSSVGDDVACDLVDLAEDDVQWRSGYVKLRCNLDADCSCQASSDVLAEGIRNKKVPRGVATRRPGVPSRIRCGFNGIRRSRARLDLSKPSKETVLPPPAPSTAIVDTVHRPPAPRAEVKDFETDFFESVFATNKGLPSALLPTPVADQPFPTTSHQRNFKHSPPMPHPEDDRAILGSFQEEFHLVPEFTEKLSCHSSSFESLPDCQLPFLDYAIDNVTSLSEGFSESRAPGRDLYEEGREENVAATSQHEDIPEGVRVHGEDRDAVTDQVLQTSNQKSQGGSAGTGLDTNPEPIPASKHNMALQKSAECEEGKMFITLSVLEPLERPRTVKEDNGSLEIILKPSLVPVECPGVENGSGDATVEVKLLIDV